MGLTISEEQEQYDRVALKALKACGLEGQMGECAERAYAEIDALRERVKTLEGALRQRMMLDENAAFPKAISRDLYELYSVLAPLKEADRG